MKENEACKIKYKVNEHLGTNDDGRSRITVVIYKW